MRFVLKLFYKIIYILLLCAFVLPFAPREAQKCAE